MEELAQFCVRVGISKGDEQDLISIVEGLLEVEKASAYDEGYCRGGIEGKEKGIEEGRQKVLSEIRNDVMIPFEARNQVLRRFGL